MNAKEELKRLRAQIKVLAVKANLSDDEAKQLQEMTEKAVKLEGQITALEQVEKADAEEKTALEAANKAAIEAGVKAEMEKRDKETAVGQRLPFSGQAPYQAKYGETRKYDNLDEGDTALMIEVLEAAKSSKHSKDGATTHAYKALALKLEGTKEDVYRVAQSALKATGLKADELNYSTQAGYGDEWVSQAWSTRLWESIRQETFVAERLLSTAVEIPQGAESIVLPLEGADLTWYKVAQTTDLNATTGRPNTTVRASKTATGNKTLTAVKMGARGVWSGEMEEDSIIPWVANLRRQLALGGAEQLEHAVIDGDTATGATTNINSIGGTPAGDEVYLLVNGFRKSPLVTTTANSRDGGTLDIADFLETIKLMGLNGRNAKKKDQVSFITDLSVAWKALALSEVLTRDVFSAPTLENGVLTGIWGYRVYESAFMHFANQDATYGGKANTAGKVNLTTASANTTGSILAVRWDQWQMGIKRRMTIKTQEFIDADATQIVALMRWGLTQRDTEASAITYNLTV